MLIAHTMFTVFTTPALRAARLANRIVAMLALIFASTCLFAQAATQPPAAAPTTAATDDVLATLNPAHPRLLWTKEAQAETFRKYGKNPLWQSLHNVILAHADAAIAQPPAQHRIPDGKRLLGESRAALHRILLTAYAWRSTGDEKYRERALVEMRTVCEFPSWNPSHFLDVAEMALAVSIGYDWLHETLSPEEKTYFANALKKLALAPGLQAYKRRNFWVTCDHNWNQVCNAGLIAAALVTAENDPAFSRDIIGRALASVPRAMRQYAPDGGYQEGPGYWEYGTTFNVVLIELLRTGLGTDKGLIAAHPDFLKTAAYLHQMRGTSGLFFNYADSGTGFYPSPAFDYLARYSPHAPGTLMTASRNELKNFLDQQQKRLRGTDRLFPMFSIWFTDAPPTVAKEKQTPLPAHFRGHADVAVLRAPKNNANTFVGIKTGHSFTNHGHLDHGSFVFDAHGIRWAEDFGGDDYNIPGYFNMDGPRWKVFRLTNRSHNTLTPDDTLQSYKAIGTILPNATSLYASAQLDNVYPEKFTAWNRTFTLDPQSGALTIQDNIKLKKTGTNLEWKLFTRAIVTVQADGRSARLMHNGKLVHLRLVSPENFTFKRKSADPKIEGQRTNPGFTQLVAEGTLNETTGSIIVKIEP